MFEAGKGRIRSPQQLFDPVPVHDLGAMDLCLEDETLSVHEQVALAALDLLTSVVAALFSAHCSGLDRLAVHYACTGLRISVQANPQTFSDSLVDPFPGAFSMRQGLK